MACENLRQLREARGWTQQDLAGRLGVSQTLVSLWESGKRRHPPRRLDQIRKFGVHLDPTALPLQDALESSSVDLAQELANLGYPPLAHYQNGEPASNPAQVLMLTLAQNQVDRRLAESLPWLVFRYPHMNWEWVLREAKLKDLQNRLGFTVLLARDLAAQKQRPEVVEHLSELGKELHRSLLAKEDTFCNERMTNAERRWLRKHRSQQAAAWNLLSDLRPEHLTHVSK